MSRSPRRLSGLPVFLLAVLALVLAMGGAATAGALVTSKQIKDNTITTKDVKNGSLLLKDLKKSDVAKLKGKNGTNGTNGVAGASAFAPPPSGTVIKGGGVLNAQISAGGVPLRSYAPLPFVTAAPLVDSGAGRSVYFGATGGIASATEENTTLCAGSATTPTAAPGVVCVYFASVSNIGTGAEVYAGADASTGDGAERSGFYVYVNSAAAGAMLARYVWAYTAP
jgi:hypothetical protein